MVELGRADASHPDGAVQQFVNLFDRQAPGVNQQPPAAGDDLNQVILRVFHQAGGANNAGNLDELAVLDAIGQLLVSDRFCDRQSRRPAGLDFSDDHHWRVLAGAADAGDLDDLPRGQGRRRNVGRELQINAGRLVLDKARIQPLVKERDNTVQANGNILAGFFQAQFADGRHGAQFPGPTGAGPGEQAQSHAGGQGGRFHDDSNHYGGHRL